MSYSKNDLKEIGLRVARNINHDLQRSKMNPYLKPYFTESSIQFIDNEDFLGIALNSNSLDIEDTLIEMEQTRFLNNMRLLKETTERYLKKEKLNDVFELKSFSTKPEIIEFGEESYTDKYKNFAIGIRKEAIDNQIQQDMIDDKVKSLVPGFTVNTYEVLQDNESNATHNDLRSELDKNQDDLPKVLANPQQGKYVVSNSSHYSDLALTDLGLGKDLGD